MYKTINLSKFKLITSSLIIACCVTACLKESHRSKASTHRLNKDYQQAIQAYHRHIETRLNVKEKPEWENPYIYYLDIGDIYLEQGLVSQAIEFYELAEKKSVKAGYVNDRFRFVARWYEDQGKLEEALKHLERYRDRDPLIFDLVLDRLARELVKREAENPPK